jgi:hypothetical protein
MIEKDYETKQKYLDGFYKNIIKIIKVNNAFAIKRRNTLSTPHLNNHRFLYLII